MNKVSFNIDRSNDVRNEVTRLEEHIASQLKSIWCNPEEREYYVKLLSLPLDMRRLWLVYSLMDSSIIKTAKYFSVDRKTLSRYINIIKNNLS